MQRRFLKVPRFGDSRGRKRWEEIQASWVFRVPGYGLREENELVKEEGHGFAEGGGPLRVMAPTEALT